MKQVTSFLLLIFFLISTVVYSQGAGSGLKKSDLEKKAAISNTDLSVWFEKIGSGEKSSDLKH